MVKTVEKWALEKGELQPDKRHFVAWAFYAAKQLHGWGEGRELTEEEFDEAIYKAKNIKIG